MNRRRSTIRLRLTALYAGAFFIAGAILIGLNLGYLARSLPNRPAAQGIVREFLDERGVRNRPVIDSLFGAISKQAEQERRETLRGMLIWSLASLGVVGVAAGGFGWLLAGRALAPLQNVTATARRVADRNLHERIALDGPDDEIKELADTFDAMLERLDRAFDGQRRFVANASHELRTPLAINRTLIEVALADPEVPAPTRRLGATLLEVNHRNERLIDGLLILASNEQPIDRSTRVDLAAIARRAISTAAPAADRADIDLRSALAPAFVAGDPALLERIAQNLVDNAVRYNRTNRGWVLVTVGGDQQSARLTVENTGPVVAPFEVDGLFEPFRRLNSERTADATSLAPDRGAGLGLSIVRSVATAHRGAVRASARPDGGLLVSVTLPACQ
ncbi:sensor histidine kinase [Mycolicibacterium stellerae]|uniref:sensor histidine kinase n=1 Tax=Mycolicibacterium stellerae TaxID=2358193 RepID=UPI000F0BB74D|nr:HAMP domain-containing sensor histidine kinase [Mycolicibacterium stellerae]